MSDYSSVGPPQTQNFNQSSAFAAALQRAKQIAAKIHPTGQTTSSNKRSLEDAIEPEAKKFSGSDYSNSQSPTQGMMSPAAMHAAAQAAAVAARLAQSSTSNNTGNFEGNLHNEEVRVPDKMVGLIIGRGGEQITRLQAETGCKIQMASDSGGSPDRVCSLNGPRDAVNKARDKIMQIVNQHGNGESSNSDGPSPNNNSMSGFQPSGNAGGNGGGSNGGGQGGGGGGGGGGNSGPYQEVMVPGPKVGLVIGKGGETIKMLQEKTGAKMVIIQDGPGQELEKPLRISGDPQKVEHAKQLVYELIQEKDPFFNNRSYNQGSEQTEIFVPKIAVGVVIGKGGDMIKKIQGETGCKLQFIQGRGDGPGDRRCIIQGTKQQVDDAKQMIEELIDSITRRAEGGEAPNRGNNGNGYGGGGGGEYNTPQPQRDEVTFVVPASKCGIIIGRGGDTIKQINSQSGAHCEMDRKAQNTFTEKQFTIKGTPEQIELCRNLVSDKIGLEIKLSGGSSNGAATGQAGYGMQSGTSSNQYPQQWGYPQTWEQQGQQQQQQQPQVQVNASGQPDYSAQWIEYYKSMGLTREAEMIEQQLKTKQPGPAAGGPMISTAPAVGPGFQPTTITVTQTAQAQAQSAAQPDYSAQWAEYYRSIGKIDEAEAIENQLKTPKAATTSAAQIPSAAAPGAVPNMGGNYNAAGANAPQMPSSGFGGQFPQFYGAPGGGQPGGHYPNYAGYGYPAGQQSQTSNEK